MRALGLAALMAAGAVSANADTGWQSIFNGKDLSGWTPKFAGSELGENYNNTFKVEGGVLKVDYSAYTDFKGEFGHLFYQTPFSSYRLKFDYRFLGEQTPGGPRWAFRNSGVMVHSQAPETMALAQEFPVSIEVQLLGQVGDGKRPTGNMCSPGTHVVIDGKLEKEHCIYSSSATFAGDDWVTAEVEVLGGTSIRHFINGKLVMEYSAPQLDPSETDTKNAFRDQPLMLRSGYISFQAESHPVEFRNIQIKLLEE